MAPASTSQLVASKIKKEFAGALRHASMITTEISQVGMTMMVPDMTQPSIIAYPPSDLIPLAKATVIRCRVPSGYRQVPGYSVPVGC